MMIELLFYFILFGRGGTLNYPFSDSSLKGYAFVVGVVFLTFAN